MGYEVKIGISNKHVHLSEEHIELLFGKGHQLTPTKPLVQPDSSPARRRLMSLDLRAPLKASESWDRPEARRR